MKTFLFIFLQHITPQHLLSRAAGWLANSKTPWIKDTFIQKFIATYNVNMDEAENSDPESYACFNDFFCRALKEGARPIDGDSSTLCSPADGAFSQLGKIDRGRIFQAKGRTYSALELLGGNQALADSLYEGQFATIYLSPKDYHRLHMPLDGELVSMTHVPGDLFSVNPATTDNVDRLFARNERVVCHFNTELGPVALVLVGAMIVASIETTWAGLVAPAGKQVSTINYNQEPITFKKGDEFARFKLGSTIIILLPENSANWEESLTANSPIKMGETIASRS